MNLLVAGLVATLLSALPAAHADGLGCDIAGKSGKFKISILLVQPHEIIVRDAASGTPFRAQAQPLVTSTLEAYESKLNALFMSESLPSLRSNWLEASRGKVEVETRILGLVDYPEPLDTTVIQGSSAGHLSSDGFNKVMKDILKVAKKQLDLSGIEHLYIVMPELVPGGTFIFGSSSLGCADTPLLGTASHTMISSFGELDLSPNARQSKLYTLVHETGHQVGLEHSQAWLWPQNAMSGPASQARHVEYGELISAMSSGIGYYAGPQLAHLGWISPEDIRELRSDEQGTYKLRPLSAEGAGPAASFRALRIQRSGKLKNEWIWLEYRQPLGINETANYEQYRKELGNPSSDPYSGAIVHWQTPETANASWAFYLPTPVGFSRASQPVIYKAWQDPLSTLKIEVGGSTPDELTIRVSR